VGKRTIFVTLALAVVWMLLSEEISWQVAAVGMFASLLCMHFVSKFMHNDEVEKVKFVKLFAYPFWLVWQIYSSAFFVIKMVVIDSKWGMITERLDLENEALRLFLADSLTLTPGSVYCDLTDKNITILCIEDKKKPGYPTVMDGLRAIETQLRKAQVQ